MAAPTILTGDLATDIINSAQKKIDMDDTIAELEPNNAPYVTILRKVRKKKATATKVEWLENERMPRFDVVSASFTSAATSIPATNASFFRVGDGVRITETGEFVEVTGVSASGIGVARAIGAVAAASGTSAAGLFIVNNANAEGAGLRTIKSVRLSNNYNYTQIIRTPFGVTETEEEIALYGQYPNDYNRLMKDAGMEHERSLEFTSIFGARKEDLSVAGAPKRWAGGLTEYITTNVTSGIGTLTRATFETIIRSAFRYGSDRKLALASPLAMAAVNGWAWNGGTSSTQQVNTDSPATQFGVNVQTYVSANGVIDFLRMPYWNDSNVYTGYIIIVDLDSVSLRPLRDTYIKPNVQSNDADKHESEWKGEYTFEIQHERRHAILKGITG